ncbi:MAG: PaaI family thioesterase [Pseudomonadota bacterium]
MIQHNSPDPSAVPGPSAHHDPGAHHDPSIVAQIIDDAFPQIHIGGRVLHVDAVSAEHCDVRLTAHERLLRPGGTISGPSLFTVADYAAYVAIVARRGADGLTAATSTMTINFLSRPAAKDVLARTSILREGRRTMVIDIAMRTVGESDLVAHAVANYVLPKR